MKTNSLLNSRLPTSRWGAAWRPMTAPALAAVTALGLGACGANMPPAPASLPSTSWSASAPDASSSPVFVECSATGLGGVPQVEGVDATAAMTASFILDAALQCDDVALVALAANDQTRLTFGNLSPEEMFALPEDEAHAPMTYETVALLLAHTPPALLEEGDLWVWPSVAAGADTDADWQALVDAGLYSEDEVERLRGEETGYLGWRLGVGTDGRWMYLTAGD